MLYLNDEIVINFHMFLTVTIKGIYKVFCLKIVNKLIFLKGTKKFFKT